jgi:riboflavin biosynthesis pyrimidine reductase
MAMLINETCKICNQRRSGVVSIQRLNLVDEYRFVVHPVVAGHSPFLFSGLQPSLRLKFVAATRLNSGIVALHYRRS